MSSAIDLLLARADAQIDAASPARTSLDPGRSRARTVAQVFEALGPRTHGDQKLSEALARGLVDLALAQLESFPENLFWDLDFPAAEILRQAQAHANPAEHAAELFGRMAELQRLYGRATVIRFRYVHDFSYGYDWAKWVRRESGQTGSVGPFDLEFLVYMRRRAHELVELIRADDQRYPQLRDARPRNPFAFSREPADEQRLHEALASAGELPVEAWNVDATPRWDQDYAQLRVDRAETLGLLLEQQA